MATQPFLASSFVLNNEELLTLICREFLPCDVASRSVLKAGRIQLRNLALVCKAFTDPALSCLWSNLTSLMPLVNLLPSVRVVDGEYVS